jgi:propanol-preferring alcohol dehydrogenase
VVVVDVSEDKRRQSLELGADVALDPADDVEAHVRADTAGLGAELVLDLVGSDATLALAARVARVRGHLTVVGIAGGTLPFTFFGLPYECSVASTYWGTYTELAEVLALAAAGRIRAEVETFPLTHALDAYDRMRAGTLDGRAVITPGA